MFSPRIVNLVTKFTRVGEVKRTEYDETKNITNHCCADGDSQQRNSSDTQHGVNWGGGEWAGGTGA